VLLGGSSRERRKGRTYDFSHALWWGGDFDGVSCGFVYDHSEGLWRAGDGDMCGLRSSSWAQERCLETPSREMEWVL
jgi:hypothetical protein